MSQHAPLYGVGLADLSIKELETLSCIHEDGLRDIDAIKQQKLSLGVVSPVSSDTFSESCIPYPTASPPVSISLNKRNLNYKTGDVHGTITAPWYDQTWMQLQMQLISRRIRSSILVKALFTRRFQWNFRTGTLYSILVIVIFCQILWYNMVKCKYVASRCIWLLFFSHIVALQFVISFHR